MVSAPHPPPKFGLLGSFYGFVRKLWRLQGLRVNNRKISKSFLEK
jgi:hypothetical protein